MKRFLLFMVALLLVGCSGSFQRPAGEEGRPGFPATLPHPLGLAADTITVPAQYPIVYHRDTLQWSELMTARQNRSRETGGGALESYRVQLYTSKLYGPAAKEFNIAREVFGEKVWFDYEVPYYKVRVGDFATRDEAEKFLPSVRDAGYDKAWVVRVNINIRTLDQGLQMEKYPTYELPDSSGNKGEPADDSAFVPGY